MKQTIVVCMLIVATLYIIMITGCTKDSPQDRTGEANHRDNLIPNSSFEADDDNDGRPDLWTAEGEISSGFTGGYRGYKGASIGFIYPGAGEDLLKTTGTLNSSLVPVLPGHWYYFSCMVKSMVFAHISVRFHWYDKGGKEIAVEEVLGTGYMSRTARSFPVPGLYSMEGIQVPHNERTYAWEKWQYEVRTPPRGAGVKISFHFSPGERGQDNNNISLDSIRLVPWDRFRIARKGIHSINEETTRIEESSTSLDIYFPRGIFVRCAKQGTEFSGITEVIVDGMTLRDPEIPVQPLVKTISDKTYIRCVYKGVENLGARIVIKTELVPKKGSVDELDWTLMILRQGFGDSEYKGVGYSYSFRSETDDLEFLVDRGTWELGGNIDGHFCAQGNIPGNSFVHRIIRPGDSFLTAGIRAGTYSVIDFQGSDKGNMFMYRDTPVWEYAVARKTAHNRTISYYDWMIGEKSRQVVFPFKYILYSPDTSSMDHEDVWLNVQDLVGARYRGGYKMDRNYHYPGVLLTPDQVTDPGIDAELPFFQDLGVKRILVSSLWREDRGGPLDFREKDLALNGVRLLSFIEQARQKEIEVCFTVPTASVSAASPLVTMDDGGWCNEQKDGNLLSVDGESVGMNIQSGFKHYYQTRLMEIKYNYQFAGLWFTSYGPYGCLPADYRHTGDEERNRSFQITHLFQFHSFLKKERLNILTDGYGPFGGSLFPLGNLFPMDKGTPGIEFVLSGISPIVPWESVVTGKLIMSERHAGTTREQSISFDPYRFIAFKAPPVIDLRTGGVGDFRAAITGVPGLVQRISRAFRDYNETFMFMSVRYIRDDAGVLWFDKYKNVYILFSFHDTEFVLPRGVTSVIDITQKEEVPVTDREFKVLSYHTYGLQ